MDNEIHDRINDNVYEGKVLKFRRDKRATDTLAIGRGTYRFVPRTRAPMVPPVPRTDGGDAA